MTQFFNFTGQVKATARVRQFGTCALCGDDLDNELEHAHHVIPQQSGNIANPNHAWLKSADNCVVLCVPCHERVHENSKFKKGAVAPATYFEFSHGKDRLSHQGWLKTMNLKARDFWIP